MISFPVVVITPPQPIVTAAEARAFLGAPATQTDAALEMMVGAAQQTIDGPPGWLWRSLGPQVLATLRPDFSCMELTFPPIIAVDSIKYLDLDWVPQTVDPADYVLDLNTIRLVPGAAWPAAAATPSAVRIRYSAGYDGNDVDAGGTGAVPRNAQYGVLMMVQHMNGLGGADSVIRREKVDGVGEVEFNVPTAMAEALRAASESLLQTLRVHWP